MNEDSNIIDFASSAAKLMCNRGIRFMMDHKDDGEKFSVTKLMSLNEGSITAAITSDKTVSGVHLNFRFQCVECQDNIKVQYSSISPDEVSSHWIRSICDTCNDELTSEENDDD